MQGCDWFAQIFLIHMLDEDLNGKIDAAVVSVCWISIQSHQLLGLAYHETSNRRETANLALLESTPIHIQAPLQRTDEHLF